jgi:hypothetical protein
MRRLRSLSEAECYARCYGSWEANVHTLILEGEAMRRRFEELLDARDPQALAEPEAA